jgi:hypothetical protein
MVLISEITEVNTTIRVAIYTEGPDHFDEWYALVQEMYPNATHIDCPNNQLTSLDCPGAMYVYCANNLLTSLNCPDAYWINCANNLLTSLNYPRAFKMFCGNNQLISLKCPNTTYLDCSNNRLTSLNCPNVSQLYCHNNLLTSIYCPSIERMQYDVYFDGEPIKISIVDRNVDLSDRDDNHVDYDMIKSLFKTTYSMTKSARK